MDKTTLVEKDIENGKRLIETLDSGGFYVNSALWIYFPDPDEWRLVIATPLYDEKGPRKAYSELQTLMSRLTSHLDLPLTNITLVSTSNDLIKLLRSAIETGPGISGIRFTRNTINGVFIDDAYIYRMQKAS